MDLKLILEQATFEALKRPEKRTVNRTVKPWVKIEPVEGKKPKFRLSSSSIELVKNETDHVFLFESNSELYIASPGYWGTSTETEYFPEKKMESRIITHGIEMTRAVLDRVPVKSYAGEWLLEFQGEVELAHQKLEKNITIKAFKLIKDAITTGETTTSVNDGIDNNETSSTGIESGVLNIDSDITESGDAGLPENEVF
jgi:hypothetical protein